jgi:hypothetical protein
MLLLSTPNYENFAEDNTFLGQWRIQQHISHILKEISEILATVAENKSFV